MIKSFYMALAEEHNRRMDTMSPYFQECVLQGLKENDGIIAKICDSCGKFIFEGYCVDGKYYCSSECAEADVSEKDYIPYGEFED